jgi:hypothetical protein
MPFPELPAAVPIGSTPACCSVCRGPLAPSEAIQVRVSLQVTTDVLLLTVHTCSEECVHSLPSPPQGYVSGPHNGGIDLGQPDVDLLFLEVGSNAPTRPKAVGCPIPPGRGLSNYVDLSEETGGVDCGKVLIELRVLGHKTPLDRSRAARAGRPL